MEKTKHYRYYEYMLASGIHIGLMEFYTVKETPQGYWISMSQFEKEPSYKNGCKWVNKDATKKFAYPTEEEALNSYIKRKRAHIRHAQASLTRAELALEKALTAKKHGEPLVYQWWQVDDSKLKIF